MWPTPQYSLTESQRDVYSSYARSERGEAGSCAGRGRVNLNLYGNKFYQSQAASRDKAWSQEHAGTAAAEGDYLHRYIACPYS